MPKEKAEGVMAEFLFCFDCDCCEMQEKHFRMNVFMEERLSAQIACKCHSNRYL
jgi:hypothetical protein